MRISDWSSDVCSSALRTTRWREWDEAGKRYGHLSGGPLADLMRQATEEIFRNAALAPGQHLLDVGTGAGSPALEARALVGPAGGSEDRRGGKERVSALRSRRTPVHNKKKKKKQ